MTKILKKGMAMLLFLTLILSANVNLVQVYAATANLKVTETGAASFNAGEKDVVVTYVIKNNESNRVAIDTATLKFDKQGFTVKGGIGGAITIDAGQETSISFYVTVSDTFNYAAVIGTFELKNGLELVYGKVSRYDVLSNVESSTGTGGKYVVAVQISHSLDSSEGIVAGADNNLRVGMFNRGNTPIKNMEVKLVLPENIFISNGSESSNLGTVSIGDRKNSTFIVSAETDIAAKTYPIGVEIAGFDYENAPISIKKTIYIPVKSEGGDASTKNIQILNVFAPAEAEAESDFIVSFQVSNSGKSIVKNMKVSADVPEGLINKTRNTFVESVMNPGETKTYSVKYFSKEAVEKTYPLKITVEPAEVAKDAVGQSVMQYASVFVKSSNSSAKTPQLLVSDYSYGGTYVQAGSTFRLNLSLLNTSGKTMTNIKVSLLAEDGTFVPVKSSNSFFIDKIGKKKTETKSVMLSVKPDAKQQTSVLNVEMSYEDGAGNAFTAKDVISIPVMQESRLMVDDIVQPELFAGNPAGVTVQFYNMGKSALNNLRATAYGDFDTMDSVNYFVGNMEPGKSDSYDFTVIPRGEGPMTGAVVFTYEDTSGEEQVFEKPFDLTVMGSMPDLGQELVPEEAKSGIKKYLPYIICGVVAVAAVAIIIVKKLRRKKKHQEMEIDE